VSRATLDTWKAKFGRQDSSNSWRSEQLEAENQQLKPLIGDVSLEIERPVTILRRRTGMIDSGKWRLLSQPQKRAQ
jgi:hypothetical protein